MRLGAEQLARGENGQLTRIGGEGLSTEMAALAAALNRMAAEIDRRIRFLTKRLEIAEVTDPSAHHGGEQVFFGAAVTHADEDGEERTVTIKGIDEAESAQGEVSWISPIARTLLRARVGDVLQLPTPAGTHAIEVVAVDYPAPTPGD